jgi:hypothetical protein
VIEVNGMRRGLAFFFPLFVIAPKNVRTTAPSSIANEPSPSFHDVPDSLDPFPASWAVSELEVP